MKKYKLTEETKVIDYVTLHRIECVTAFGNIVAGEKGGFVEKEDNLSQTGNAWVCGEALVCGNARVCGDARVYGEARVYDNARVCGEARVCGNADYIVFKNWWSSGRYFTWTRSNNMWAVECFYGTGDQLIAKAYKDSEKSGREYERIVNYVNDIIKEEKYNGGGNNSNG